MDNSINKIDKMADLFYENFCSNLESINVTTGNDNTDILGQAILLAFVKYHAKISNKIAYEHSDSAIDYLYEMQIMSEDMIASNVDALIEKYKKSGDMH